MTTTRRKKKKTQKRRMKIPRSLLPPKSRLPMSRERSPSLLLHQLQSSRRSLMSLGNPTTKSPKPKPMLAMTLSAQPPERRASYQPRRQIVLKTPRKRGREMMMRRMIARRIVRAKTATKTGSNSAPRLLHISVCIICFLALGQLGVWLCYRLFGMSSQHSVVWCTYCFWIYVEWDVLPWRCLHRPGFLLSKVYLFFLVTMVKPSSSTSGAGFSLRTDTSGGASSISTSPPLSPSSSSLSPDSQSVSWS